ncbi:DUF1554 domain-containing protein [Leptospira jelokensis]|uniref:DUF1554 domain-containing protein n=1 Tax=Leptospira jelokensis TaxID=2484931 RepID=A0A4Z0ZRY5_9LEPT|nr:DUF1554 domain-containing protein [Leptospira jelokensis]TGL65112.1 DUF1554 domain-containing protein [Leptospira jelokensis]
MRFRKLFTFTSHFLMILFFSNCEQLERNNVCDPNSESFKEIQISKFITKDSTPTCGKDYISTIIPYSISGSISGLTSTGLKLSLNGAITLSVDIGSSYFSFSNILNTESAYSVSVSNQPVGLICNASNSEGIVKKSDVNSISINCEPTCNPCFLFLTNSGYPPNPGSAKNFDSFCNTDGNYPGTGIYKAMVVDGVSRIASISPNVGDGQIDWIFAPNRTYSQTEGEIGTTNSTGLFTTTLLRRFSPNSKYWTGLNSNWTTNSGNTCDLWRDNSGSFSGIMGQGNSTSIADITAGWTPDPCNLSNQQLICVEQ